MASRVLLWKHFRKKSSAQHLYPTRFQNSKVVCIWLKNYTIPGLSCPACGISTKSVLSVNSQAEFCAKNLMLIYQLKHPL